MYPQAASSSSPIIQASLLDYVSDAVISTDLSFVIHTWNQAAEKIYGWRAGEVIGRHVDEVVHTEFLSDDQDKQIEQMFVSAGHWEGHVIQHTKDGQPIHIMASVVLIRDTQGRPVGTVAVNRDITARMQAEQVAHHYEQRLRRLIEQSRDGISLIDEKGRLIEWNPAMESITGMPAEDVLGQFIWDVQFRLGFPEEQTPETYQQLKSMLEDALQRGQAAWFGKLAERAFLSPSSGSRYLQSITFPIPTESGFMLSSISRDITERRQMEVAVQESAKRLEMVMEGSQLGYWDWNIRTGEVHRNQRWAEMLGFTLREIERTITQWDDLLHPDDRALAWKSIQEHLEGLTERHVCEYRLRARDGTYKWIRDQARIVERDAQGLPLRMSGTHTDITEQKQAQDLIRMRLRLMQFAEKHSLNELMQTALDEVEAITSSQVSFYHFVEPDQTTLLLQTWSKRTLAEYCTAEGRGLHYNIDEAGVWADSVRERRPVIHNSYATLPHRKGLPDGHAQLVRELVTPTFRDGEIKSILGVGNKPEDYTARDAEIVEYIADVIWEIIERKRDDEALQASLREKEALLAEIHHRVKNNLQMVASLLDFQSHYTQEESARAALQDSLGRVYSMALIHEQLYRSDDLTHIDFAVYANALLTELISVQNLETAREIETAVDIQDIFMDVKQAIPCGLIINELASNAIKHAFPSTSGSIHRSRQEIRVALRAIAHNKYELSVSDNGMGLPGDFKFPDDRSMGLFLIQTFTQQLKGEVEWLRDGGTTCRIVFPVELRK